MSASTATVSASPSAEAPPPGESTAMSPVQQQPPPSSPYRFSAEAAPFTPSYMRTPTLPSAAAQVPPMTLPEADGAAAHDDEEEEGDDAVDDGGTTGDDDRERFSKMWMYCLQQMQGHEVGMLMDMMPPDIQDLYADKLSDEYLLHDHEHKDKSMHALRAAHKMVQELTPEQLVNIEAFLHETDALNPNAKRRGNAVRQSADGENGEGLEGEHDNDDDDGEDGALFVHGDDTMGSDEEEWLLEQMMAAGGKEGCTAALDK